MTHRDESRPHRRPTRVPVMVLVATACAFVALLVGPHSARAVSQALAGPVVTDAPSTTDVTVATTSVAPSTEAPSTEAPSTTARPVSTYRYVPTTTYQYQPPRTVADPQPADTTVTTTQNLLVGPTPSSTTTTSTSTTLPPRTGSASAGGSSDPKVWAVVAGLLVVALGLGILTFRFWRNTRPGTHGSGRGPRGGGPGGGSGGGPGSRRRRTSRYGDLVITVPESH